VCGIGGPLVLLPWLKFFNFMAPALGSENKIEFIATVSRE
jgi:hypothetical protein